MSIRTERVAKLLQREVADILNKEIAADAMVTVTDARVTKDLSIAYIYVSIFGGSAEERQANFRHLEAQLPQIRMALAGRVRHQLRQIPELRLFLDESAEYAQKMEGLFDRIRAERRRREGTRDAQ